MRYLLCVLAVVAALLIASEAQACPSGQFGGNAAFFNGAAGFYGGNVAFTNFGFSGVPTGFAGNAGFVPRRVVVRNGPRRSVQRVRF